MAERDEGIWGGEAGELGRKLSYPAAQLTLAPRTGSEWGLASLLTGLACLIVCPTTLLVWASVIAVHDARWSKTDVRNMCTALIGCEFLVLGLVMFGIAQPTEAAAAGIVGSILMSLLFKTFSWRMIYDGCFGAAKMTSAVLIIIASSKLFSQVLSFTGATAGLIDFVA